MTGDLFQDGGAAQPPASEPAADAPQFSRIVIGGESIRVTMVRGAQWFCLWDLTGLMGYESQGNASNLRRMLHKHGMNPEAFLVASLRPKRMLFINRKGLEHLIRVLPPARTAALRQWLGAANGMAGGQPQPEGEDATVYIAALAGLRVHVALHGGQVWMHRGDAGRLLGYKSGSVGVKMELLLASRGATAHGFQVRIRFGRCAPPAFVSAAGLLAWSDAVHQQGRTAVLRAWLGSFGQWMGTAEELGTALGAVAIEARAMPLKAVLVERVAQTAASPVNDVAAAPAEARSVVKPAPTPPPPQTKGMRGYAIELTRTIGRYASDAEVSAVVVALEAAKADILRARHCPGLNDAAYDLYARMFLGAAGEKK